MLSALTPLHTVPAFDPEALRTLGTYWITSAEEFVSTAEAGNARFGSGLRALGQVLSRPEADILALVQAARAVCGEDRAFALGPAPLLGTGAIFERMYVPLAAPPTVALPDLPAETNLATTLPPPQQQGERNTCLAFTLVSLYQFAAGEDTDLSEQFLYWACKERDGIPHVQGTRPDIALMVLRDIGVCPEENWAYEPQPTPRNEGQGPPPVGAIEAAQHRRIAAFSSLPTRDVHQMKASLVRGHPFLLGVPIQQHWPESWQARTLGRVRAPLPGEAELGGHALSVFGYRDAPDVPGGGYFIARNSWGTTWGVENPDGAGYCHLPYQLVYDEALVACVINALAPDSRTAQALPTPLTQLAPLPAPSAMVGGAQSPDTPLAALPSDLPPAVEAQALYHEARLLRARLNTLVERLAVLTQRLADQPDDTDERSLGEA